MPVQRVYVLQKSPVGMHTPLASQDWINNGFLQTGLEEAELKFHTLPKNFPESLQVEIGAQAAVDKPIVAL